MRIALLSVDNSKEINIGGKHVHQNLLERGLKSLGIEVTTFYPKFEKRRWLRAMKIVMSSPFSAFSAPSRFEYRIKRAIKFFLSIDINEFDLIHCHDVVSLYSITHPRVLLTLHGYLAREAVNYMPSKTPKRDRERIFNFCMQIEKEALKKANHVITVDTRLKNYLIQEFNYPAEKITVVYNAVDAELFSPIDEDTKLSLRKELNLPKNAFIVLVPRRYVKKNGVDYAAWAFSKIKSSDHYFIFAGGGPMKQEIQSILENNDNVLILDGVPNSVIHKYYKAADVILIPSVTSDDVEEATSLSMLEGMACGKVVICTNVGGMKEVVRNMENGILIEQKDPNAIIEALEYVKNNYDSLEQLRNRAREYVLANHSYLEHAKKIVKVYELLLSKEGVKL